MMIIAWTPFVWFLSWLNYTTNWRICTLFYYAFLHLIEMPRGYFARNPSIVKVFGEQSALVDNFTRFHVGALRLRCAQVKNFTVIG